MKFGSCSGTPTLRWAQMLRGTVVSGSSAPGPSMGGAARERLYFQHLHVLCDLVFCSVTLEAVRCFVFLCGTGVKDLGAPSPDPARHVPALPRVFLPQEAGVGWRISKPGSS